MTLGFSHSLSLPSPPLPFAPQPPGISSAHREKRRGPAGDRTQMPTLALSIVFRAGITSQYGVSSPYDLTFLCASLHMYPTSQPCHSHTLISSPPCLAHAGSSSQKASKPSSLPFSSSLLSKPYLSICLVCNPLTSFVLPSHSPHFKAMPSKSKP